MEAYSQTLGRWTMWKWTTEWKWLWDENVMWCSYDGTVRGPSAGRPGVVSGVHRCVRRLSAVCPGYVRRLSAGRWKSDATPDRPPDGGRGYYSTWYDDVYSDDVVTEVKQNVWHCISVLAAAAAVLIIINYLLVQFSCSPSGLQFSK